MRSKDLNIPVEDSIILNPEKILDEIASRASKRTLSLMLFSIG